MEKPLLFNRGVKFVDLIFRIIEGQDCEFEAVTVLKAAEQANGVELSSVCPYPAPEPIPDEQFGEKVLPPIEGLFFETNLILGIYEFNRLYTLFDGDRIFEWGHREWGITVSRWANKAKWLGKDDWTYIDFYAGPNNGVIKDYDAWASTVQQVIRKKSQPRIQSLLPRAEEIVNTLRTDPDVNKRLMAVGSLASFETPLAIKALEQALKTDPDQMVRSLIHKLSS